MIIGDRSRLLPIPIPVLILILGLGLVILVLVLVLVLGSIPVSLGVQPQPSAQTRTEAKRSLAWAISSVEEALGEVEEIQLTETLEEARELAIDAEEDLRKAISILEDIEIPNYLWLPQQGALYFHGPILDKETEQPIQAAIHINGHLIARTQEVQLLMWATEENPVWVEVRAEGYKPWGLRFRFHLRGLEVMEGPVRLVKAKEG